MSEISIKKAATINAAAKYSVVIMNIAFTAILSRILSPNDYGIVAVVAIFTTLFAKISDMGFGTAVIQRKDLSKSDVNSIFTFTIYLGLILLIAFICLGYPISLIYKNSRYEIICAILSLSIFLNTINMVPNAILMKEKKFALVGIRIILVNLAGYCAAIILALMGFKYYSLVLQSVIAALLDFMWNFHTSKLKTKLKIDFEVVKSVASFSMFQFAFNLVNFFETNLDNLLVSTVMGSTFLAFYDKSYRLTKYPVSYLSGVISPVLHPILSNYQNDRDTIYNKYIKIQRLISTISILFVPICFSASYEIIILMYGGQWGVAVKPFQYLSLAIYPMLLMSTSGPIYQSLGNTKLLFKAGIINAIVTGSLIICGIIGGNIERVAICVALANWCNMIITFSIMMVKGFGQSAKKIFKNFIDDIIAIVFMIIFLEITSVYLPVSNILLSFVLKLILNIIMYCAYLCLSKKYRLLFPQLVASRSRQASPH